MAIVYQGNRGTKTGTSALSGLATISPASIIEAGNLCVMTVAALVGAFPQNINDTQGNVWEVDLSLLNTSRVSICSSVLAFELQSTDTISLNVGVSLTYDIDLEEFSGILETAYKDVSATNSGAGTALTSGTTAATAQNSELAVAAWAIKAAQSTFTPGGSYSAFGIVSQTGLALFGEYLILSSTGTQSASGTAGTTGTWAGGITTYKGGAGTPEIRGPDPFMTR